MPEYARIYCDTQRKRDMSPRGKRGGRPLKERSGACFAMKVADTWRCCCCGKRVRIVI